MASVASRPPPVAPRHDNIAAAMSSQSSLAEPSVSASVADSLGGSSQEMSSGIIYDRPVTIFEDRTGFNIKHPLTYSWTLWTRSSNKGTGPTLDLSAATNVTKRTAYMAKSEVWAASLQFVNTVESVEDFWSLYNNIPAAMGVPLDNDYMFFRDGIKPAWEDPANAEGGALVIQIKVGYNDSFWLSTLLACVGCAFTRHSDICGIVFAKRGRADRIALWLRTNDRSVAEGIEREWLELLKQASPDAQISVVFNVHSGGGGSHGGSSGGRPPRSGNYRS